MNLGKIIAVFAIAVALSMIYYFSAVTLLNIFQSFLVFIAGVLILLTTMLLLVLLFNLLYFGE